MDKKQKEQEIVKLMISLYCRKKHGVKAVCSECESLINYSNSRIESCRFSETKTFCSSCKSHCYKPDMRERIREVMRFSGPRMLLYHPIPAIKHLFEKK